MFGRYFYDERGLVFRGVLGLEVLAGEKCGCALALFAKYFYIRIPK